MRDFPKAESGAYVGDLTPLKAWEMLKNDASAELFDVRTDAEFNYVGRPELSSIGKDIRLVMWVNFPENLINPEFVNEVKATGVEPAQKLLFLCRSGVRSRFAAAVMTAAGFPNCYNILEGFEGNKDARGHRGVMEGWKVAELPWVQG